MKRPIAIIPARGGSKRLPRKNILPLGGKPLLAHVVTSALDSNVFERVIVSTEDEEISQIACDYGAEVFARDVGLAQDTSTVVEVCLDVLEKYTEIERFCCLYATAALLSRKTIAKTWELFKDGESDVLMGVSSYNYSPVQALVVDNKGSASLLFDGYKGIQSQNYPKVRVSNGSLYWASRQSFIKGKTFYSENLSVFDVPEDEVCDVDTQEDYIDLLTRYENSFQG